jgi:D-glucuronyl C5-epimerase C-terminus
MQTPPQLSQGIWRECSIGLVLRRLAGLLVLAAFPSSAAAAPVVVLGPHGHAVTRNDPFVTGPALTPAPTRGIAAGAPSRRGAAAGTRASAAASGGAAAPGTASKPKKRKPPRKPEPTVASELAKLYHRHQITLALEQSDTASFNRALAAELKLKGTRRTELSAVTENLHQIAASGSLSASRLPVLFDTLERNREWWTTGPLLSAGERVEFTDSQLVWEYYAGQGIELQVLGSFGKADGLYTAGPADYPALQALLAEIIPLAAQRGGGLTWEYYFNFDGGRPPWTSAMSQATGLEALSRAYLAFHDPGYLDVARQALAIFSHGPPVGVRVPTPLGTRFLQYSFAPGTSIINAFLQTLIGLYDYAKVSGSAQATQLFDAGEAEALAEVPQFDTGAWSLYQPGVEDPLSYHQLVTGFLQQLCARTAAPVYCTTAQHFQADLTTPPALALLTGRARLHKATRLRFRLSKTSRVGIVVLAGNTTILSTSATFGHGVGSFAIPSPKRTGIYTVRLSATDLAGNFNQILGTLSVSR